MAVVTDKEDIRRSLDARDFKRIRQLFRDMNVADIAETLGELEIVDVIVLFRLIQKSQRAEVFSYLRFELQEEMLDRLPDVVVVSLINEMDPVDRTQLLEELPPEISGRIILKLSPEERKIAWKLLSYPEGSVGRLMSPEFVALKHDMTCDQALAHIRWNAVRYPELILHHVFAIDNEGHLQGRLSLASLVIADPSTQPVSEIMDSTVQPLSVNASESEAVDFFRKYDVPFIPVVDENHILVGIVEADSIFDVAEEEATEDIQQFGGSSTLENSYFDTSFWTLLRKRAGWLTVLFTGSMFTANALEHFNDTIRMMSYLVFFLPLVISSGGNSGSQSASLIIRGLAVKEVGLRDWHKVLRRELAISLWLGLILGSLGFARAVVGGQGHITGMIIFSSLVFVVVFGATLGSMLPFLLKMLRLDPAVSSSPVIASVSDLTGIFFFFNIAIMVLKMFGQALP